MHPAKKKRNIVDVLQKDQHCTLLIITRELANVKQKGNNVVLHSLVLILSENC